MTDGVGLLRCEAGLKTALAELDSLEKLYGGHSLEWRNRSIVARLMIQAALLREESRGVHRRKDFAQPDTAWRKHIVFHKDQEYAFHAV